MSHQRESDQGGTLRRPPLSQGAVRFGDFTFDPLSLELQRHGASVTLEPQPAKVLRILVGARGALVTREELVQNVWGGRFLAHDQSINYCIRQIRAALDDDANDPRFVETLPRRGYRFIADSVPAAADATTVPAQRGSHRRWLFVTLAIAGSVVVGIAGWRVAGHGPQGPGPGWRDDGRAAAEQLTDAARVRFLMATRWLATRQHPGYTAIVAVLDSVLAERPDFVPAVVHRAEALLWSGRTGEARRVLDSLLRVSPELAQAHTLRGALALFREGNPSKAEAAFERGVRLAPWSSEAHHYAAYGALFRGDTAQVRRELERALELDPLSPTLDGDAGMVFYYLGDLQTADSLCERGGRVDSTMRAPLLCRLLIAAARQDTGAVAHAAAYLARLDGAPASVVGASHAPAGLDLRALFRWELARGSGRGSRPAGSLLMRLRWMVLAGDAAGARALVRAPEALDDPSRAFVPLDPLVARAVEPERF